MFPSILLRRQIIHHWWERMRQSTKMSRVFKLPGIEVSAFCCKLPKGITKAWSQRSQRYSERLRPRCQKIKSLEYTKKNTHYICGMLFCHHQYLPKKPRKTEHIHTLFVGGLTTTTIGAHSFPCRVADGNKACNSLGVSPVRAMPRLLLPEFVIPPKFPTSKNTTKKGPVECRKPYFLGGWGGGGIPMMRCTLLLKSIHNNMKPV